jgi:hypothetical protein
MQNHRSSGCIDGEQAASAVANVVSVDELVRLVTLPIGIGMLPITLSIAQVCSWTGLKKTKVQDLINAGSILTAKVDGRTLVLTGSVIALIERNRIKRGE